MRWSADCQHLTVAVERPRLEDAFWSVWGTAPNETNLPIALDLRAGPVASWLRLVRWTVNDIDNVNGLSTNPLTACQVDDLLVHGFVAAQGRGTERPSAAVSTRSKAMVQEAKDYIESHAADPISVSDVAHAVGTSVRRLQESFRRHAGVTPMTYLRDVRLDRADRALRSADPSGAVTVTEVALKWGFGHLPRFAAAYRRRFGRLPSETLQRTTYPRASARGLH
jgi:AraC-like DNA-binding protein